MKLGTLWEQGTGGVEKDLDKSIDAFENAEKLDKLMTEGDTLSAEIQDNRLQMDAAYMRYFVWLGAAITLGLVAMHRAAK